MKTCRLCGKKNKYGRYCKTCVPKTILRNVANYYADDANFAMIDWRMKNGMSMDNAAKLARVSTTSWSKAESGIEEGRTINERTRARIAKVVGIPESRLFQEKPRSENQKPTSGRALRPGENQRLIAADCREAEKAGYGHQYGAWRAGILIER